MTGKREEGGGKRREERGGGFLLFILFELKKERQKEKEKRKKNKKIARLYDKSGATLPTYLGTYTLPFSFGGFRIALNQSMHDFFYLVWKSMILTAIS